jgi:uncharacterized protein YyaL (SSP411 family)
MHTNKLINETSPYLLQHAQNPVNWFPWGEEALQKAKDENKPILVSIGYAACHWCHVMERESFENEETAILMNENFINIKIDREERPDLDHIYMDAVQSMTGSGGWPLNVFLTPELKPFYGGTYFPPVAAFNKTSWPDVLKNISKAYKEKKHEIDAQAENLTEHLASSNSFGINSNVKTETVFTQENLNLIAENILKQADKTWGGFGKAPKFPQTLSIQYLLRHYHFTKDENALQQALLSLDKMIYGGMYDQLGGGFARYSTDEKWLAPHFEKMLYDNALLIGVLSEAYQLTKKQLYAETIKQTMQFIEREMLSNENGFYAALDADSEGVEGKFYTWSKQEVDEILQKNAELFCEFYGVVENGNWSEGTPTEEHTNILWIQEPLQEFAERKNIDILSFKNILQQCNEKLFNERSKRIRPQLDDKILLGWNALMNIAYCKAYAALGIEKYKNLAIANIEFLEIKLQTESGWHHTYKNNQSKIPAFLDDYAYLINAYIHLQEISGNSDYLIKAKQLTEFVIDNFSEEESGYFFYTNQSQTDVIVRKKEVYDGATPSGNAVMALNLHYLSIIFNEAEWLNRSIKIVSSLNSAITRYPTSFGVWACVFQLHINSFMELVVVGKEAYHSLLPVLQEYIPNKILQSTQTKQEKFPLLKGKFNEENLVYYVCKNYICLKPVNQITDFLKICKA